MRTLETMLANLQALASSAEGEQLVRDYEMEQLALARAERRQLLQRAGAGLAPAVRDSIVDGNLDLDHTKALRAVVRWRARGQDYPTLVLRGERGTGKSVAAAWYCAQEGGVFRSASVIARAWASTTNQAANEQLLMCTLPVLVCDDVGTELEHQKAAMGAALRELLEARQGLHTIITTNLTRDAFALRWPDERLQSRLELCAWVHANGPDLRRRDR